MSTIKKELLRDIDHYNRTNIVTHSYPYGSQAFVYRLAILGRLVYGLANDLGEEEFMKTILTIKWLMETIALQFIALSLASLLLIWFARSGW